MLHRKLRQIARRGVAAVEFAVLLPLLMLLLVGAWEVGRMVEVQQLLTSAAREGGRQAAASLKTADQVKADVVNFLQQNGITSVTTSNVTVQNLTSSARNDPTKGEQLDRYRVAVSIPFDSVRWILLNQITSVTTLNASADWYCMRDVPVVVNADIPLN